MAEVGKTNALIFAIGHARAPLLLTVDDDNVLDPDYLEKACEIAGEFPHLGVWGGSCRGEFEVEPPDWARPYLAGLAVDELDRDYWTNLPGWSTATPPGAGMCTRKCVALEFVRRMEAKPRLRQLGRTGHALTAGEDTFMVDCALDEGMGSGRFARLRLTHLIPKERLDEDYLVRLHAGFKISSRLLEDSEPQAPSSWLARLRGGYGSFWQKWHATPIERRIMKTIRYGSLKDL